MTTLFQYVIDNKMAGNRTSFWNDPNDGDKYGALNKAWPPKPSAEAIHKYQMQKIFQFNKIALDVSQGNYNKFNELAKLLLADTTSDLPSQYTNEQNKEISERIKKVFDNIVEMRAINRTSWEEMDGKTKHDLMLSQLKELSSQLNILKNTLSINSRAYEENLTAITNAINALSKIKTLGTSNAFTDFWRNLNQIQGDLLEELGTGWFNERIPSEMEIHMITTGNVSLNTTRSDRHSGQIIQDMLSLDISGNNLDSVHISYYLKGKKQNPVTLREFINLLDNHSPSDTKIVIDDEGYDVLLNLSKLNIQAKSGKNQMPWNVNASTSVSISEYANESAGGYLSAAETFSLLYQLDTEDPTDKWVVNEDPDNYYQALANYGLATVLYKVMHIDNYEGNQLILTPNGFMTFAQRINQIFQKNPNGYITLSGSVFSNGKLNSLTTPHHVNIPKWILLAS